MNAQAQIYVPHRLHAADRAYRETNCYTDVLIELLHSRGLDPVAGLGHLVRTDFEGDQFTFFKMPQGDIELLYGVDIHEMQPVGKLPDQIERQLELGRTMLVELDSFYLPDTAATDYRHNHVKSTVAAAAINQQAETFRYFHNTGCHELSGADYRGIFGLDGRAQETLPPYLEVARFDCAVPLKGEALRSKARELLAMHLERRPSHNPFAKFGKQLAADLQHLVEADGEAFHAYAFATVRMAGASFDLLRTHLDWLFDTSVANAFDPIVDGCQILSFRLARRRAFDPAATIKEMAETWAAAMTGLERALN